MSAFIRASALFRMRKDENCSKKALKGLFELRLDKFEELAQRATAISPQMKRRATLHRYVLAEMGGVSAKRKVNIMNAPILLPPGQSSIQHAHDVTSSYYHDFPLFQICRHTHYDIGCCMASLLFPGPCKSDVSVGVCYGSS